MHSALVALQPSMGRGQRTGLIEGHETWERHRHGNDLQLPSGHRKGALLWHLGASGQSWGAARHVLSQHE